MHQHSKEDINDKLREAMSHLKAGNKASAKPIIAAVLKEDNRNANAWYLAAYAYDDPERKIKALETALSINPNHADAKRALAKLKPTDELDDLLDSATAEDDPRSAPSRRKGASPVLVALLVIVVLGAGIAVGGFAVLANRGVGIGALVAPELPEMFIKHGITVRYPQGWMVEDRHMTGITIQPYKDDISTMITIYPSFDVDTSQYEFFNFEHVKANGLVIDGKVLLKPNGEYTSSTSTVSGYPSHDYRYLSENTVMRGHLVDVGGRTILAIAMFSSKVEAVEPLFNSMVSTIKIDPSQFLTWDIYQPSKLK